MLIRPLAPPDVPSVARLSLRAWAPVFESLERELGPEVFPVLYPDWRASQKAAVEAVCADAKYRVWIAERGGAPVGFAAVVLHESDRVGEIYMIAVDPEHQRAGIASALTQHALGWIREAGMQVAMVATGGDPGHAPARRTYERAGFRPLPLAQYYRKL
jgi:GNAT superfamily N-acetyltransferase